MGALGVTLIALIGAAFVAVGFVGWRQAIERRLVQNSRVVQTAAGAVEYADLGSGPAILVIHGTPGGYDTVAFMQRAANMAPPGYRLIAPSRPGYLRTPSASGRTPAEQARLYAALLDKLGIDKVVVLGVSGGGPSALQFAILHPERCRALILEEAVTRSIDYKPGRLPPILTDFLIYILRDKAIRDLRDRDPGDPALEGIGAAVMDTLVPMKARIEGQENDSRAFARMDDWPLDRIRCPTLILQGTLDKDVPAEHADYAHARIAGSELVWIKGADHLMPATRHKELGAVVATFLARLPD